MQSMVDGMTKAIVAFNGQIGAKDFHSAFKFSRGDASNWSQDFATQILPTLMNELKKSSKTDASQTGNALKSMSRVVMDGIMTPDALNKWNGLGMLTPGAFKRGKGGKLQKNGDFMGPAMLGGSVWQENPYQWVQDYLLPHMKAKGVDVGNRKSVVAALGGLFGNRVANHIATLLATQQAIIEKDKENVKKAMGTNGLNFLMNADPTTRMQVLSAALKDFGGALGDIALPGTMRLFKGMIDWAHAMRDAVGSSSYVQSLGSHFDAAIAGMFGQRLGRRQMANGRDREYWNAGRSLSGGWSAMTSSIGKMMRFWEETGVVTGAMNALGTACSGVSMAMDTVRGGLQIFKDALTSDFVKGLTGSISDMIKSVLHPEAPTYDEAKKGLSAYNDAKAAAGADPDEARKKLLDSLQPIRPAYPGVTKLPPMVRQGSDLAKHFAPPPLPTFAAGGGMPSPGSVIQPIAASASAFTPMFQKAGGDAIQALANGLQSGAGAATGQMSALMGSLNAIAAAGVKVPVTLDTAGAESQLNGLMARASKIGAGAAGRPQFSKSLNDTGG